RRARGPRSARLPRERRTRRNRHRTSGGPRRARARSGPGGGAADDPEQAWAHRTRRARRSGRPSRGWSRCRSRMRAPGSPPCHVRHVPVLAIRRYASRSIAVNRGDLEIDSFGARRSIVGRMQTPLDPIPPSVAHALLTAHLLVWTVLALYGLHRLHLLRLFRGRERGPDQNSRPAESADSPVEWP